MAKNYNLLFEVTPLNGTTPITLRLTTLSADKNATTANGQTWLPCITSMPDFGMTLSADGLLDEVKIERGEISFFCSDDFTNHVWSSYIWNNAYYRAWYGENGTDFASYSLLGEGRTTNLERDGNQVTVRLLGPEADLTSKLLSKTYAGAGQSEGPLGFKGNLKPRCFGSPLSVEPVELDPVNLVYQVHGYGAVMSIQPYEYGLPLEADQFKGNTATYADLIALQLVPGEYATCLAEGMFRFGGTPTPKITADVTMSGGTTLADIATAILTAAGVAPAKIGSFAAVSTVQTNLYVTSQVEALEALQSLFQQAGCYLFADKNGTWQCGKFYASTKSAVTLNSDRSTFPILLDWKEEPTKPPIKKVSYGFQRCWGVHSDSEASPIINELAQKAEENAYWENIKGEGKPEDNATVGAPEGTFVAGKPAEAVINAITDANGVLIPSEQLKADIAAAEQIAADLQTTYGTTVSAAASADAAAQHEANAHTASSNAQTALNDAKAARDAAAGKAQDSEAARAAAVAAQTASELARSQSQTFANSSDAARVAAELARGQSQGFAGNSEASKIASEAAKTVSEQARNQAQQYAANADGSAAAAAGHASTASTKANEAGQSASAAQASQVSASTTAQSLMPPSFGDLRNWTWDFSGGTSDLSSDGRFVSYDHGTLGRVLEVDNNPHFTPHIASKGRVTLIRDHVYRITVKWCLGSENENDTARAAAIYAIGFRPDGSQWNDVAAGFTVAPGQAGWGSSSWATHYLDVHSNTLLDQGVTWVRPLFRLDSQGRFLVQSIEFRDITGEYFASGSATAAANSASSAAILKNGAEQSASAAQQSATNAATSEGNAGQSAGAANQYRSDAQTFRNEASQSATNASGSASTAQQQAGLAANSANQAGQSAGAAAGSASTASSKASEANQSAAAAQASSVSASTKAQEAGSRASGNLVGKASFSADGQKGEWNGSTYVSYDGANAGAYVMVQTSRDNSEGDFVAGQWDGRRFRITGNAASWGGYNAAAGIQYIRHDDVIGAEYGLARSRNAGYGDFSLEVVLPTNIRGIKPILISDGPHGASDHAVGWKTIRIEDITSETTSKGYADAASTSASQAGISQNQAGNSASAAQQSATNASTSEGNAWNHRAGAAAHESNAQTYRNEASQSASNASGSAATATQQAGLAAGSANQSGQSAAAAAGSASTANTKASEASQSASAALASSVSASTAAQALMPATFGDIKNWSGDWGTATGSLADDPTHYNAYDHGTYGRILDVYNSPHFGPHMVPKGRIALVRDKVYRITVKWALTGYQLGSPVNATIFAIGIRPNSAATGDYWNSINTAISISEGQIGWGSFWATHTLDVHSNTLMDQGCAWTRPLFRIDNQGHFAVQSIEIRDITGEYHAAGSASAAAGSESAAAIYKGQAEQSASAANTSRTNAATSENNAWDHRVAAAGHESNAQTYRNEASQSKSDAAGSAATAAQQANLAAGSANQAGQSASAAAGSASGAASSADAAGRSASAAQSAEVSATSAAQSMMPSTFLSMKDWTWDYRVGSSDLSGDNRWSAYDHGTLGRIVQIQNNPHFSPHTAPKGRVALIRDHVYRITVKWALFGQQNGEVPQNAAIFAIGIRPDQSDWNNVNMGVSVSPGQAGWGSGNWATHYLDVHSNTLMDAGCAWVRPLFRLDNQGVYGVQSIEIRDITGEYNAAGSASAAAGSASTASIKANEAGQSASAANTSQTNAATHEGAAWDHRVAAAGHESQAGTYRNEASQSASNAAGSASTASQQAGLASNSASQAGGSASAAAGSASTASTKASEASQSASAAQSSQVSAGNSAAGAQQQFAKSFPNFVGPIGKNAYDYAGDNGAGFSWENGPDQGWPQPYITAQGPGQGGRWNRITFKESMDKVVGRRYRVTGWFFNHGNNCANVSIWLLRTNNNQWDGNATGHGGDAVAPDCVNGVALNQGGFWKVGVDFTVDSSWPSKWKPIFEFQTTGAAPNGLWHMTGMTITDITSEKAAADSASAASSSYSNALYEAGLAAQRAEAASGHANTASIKAGEAQGSANAASGSAAQASGSASAASSSANLAATFSTGGGNLIPEAAFAVNTSGWNFYSPFDNNQFSFGRDHAGDDWRPTNEHNIGIQQKNGDTSTWSQWHSDQISVEGSKWYEFSGYVAAHRCNAYIRVDWLDANGNGIGNDYTNTNTASKPGGRDINAWMRCWGKVQAPSNAARAHVVFVKDPTWGGYSDSYAWLCRPMLRQTYEQASGPSPYSTGSGALTAASQQASISQNATAIATANSSLANLTTVVQSGSPNLLRNGGFSQGMNYWGLTHGGWNPHVSGGWGQIADRAGDWSGEYSYIESAKVPVFGGTPYTVSADSLYYLFGGSGHSYTELVWFDGNGNYITQNTGTGYNANHDFSINGDGRKKHALTATSPGNATHVVARLVHYKANGSSVNVIGWRQVKLEQSSVMTAYSNEASVTTIAETVTSVDGKANQALARAGISLDVNGYVSGWEIANNGANGSMTINADQLAIRKPGGGARTEYSNGRWMATDGSSYMTVWGAPFGQGNRFLRWSGPYNGDLNTCHEGNAKEYLRVDGSMFFGGALLAGSLRNSQGSSGLASNASTQIGPFGSNGNTITVNASWTYSFWTQNNYGADTNGVNDYNTALDGFGRQYLQDFGTSHTGSKPIPINNSHIVLNLRRNGGLVASQGGGNGILSLEGYKPTPGDAGGWIKWTYNYSTSFTYTDPENNTSQRTYTADITRGPLSSGNQTEQRVFVTSVEG